MCAVAATAFVLAIAPAFILEASDYLFQSRLLPWTVPLMRLQAPGFTVAARLLPGVAGALKAGQAYIWFPVFLLSNAAFYVPFLLLGLFVSRRYQRIRRPSIFPLLIRWDAGLGFVGLCARLLLYRLTPDVSLPMHKWDLGRLEWVVLDNATGIAALLLFLLIPFCGYRVVRVVWRGHHLRPELTNATWLWSFAAAILLGSQWVP